FYRPACPHRNTCRYQADPKSSRLRGFVPSSATFRGERAKIGTLSMAWRSFALAVLCVLAACRIGFDAFGGDAAGTDAGGSTDVDGALPAVPLWAAMFGEGPEETIAARVLEDTAGDLWLAGSTF